MVGCDATGREVLDEEHPAATVAVGDWGDVELDLALLLRP